MLLRLVLALGLAVSAGSAVAESRAVSKVFVDSLLMDANPHTISAGAKAVERDQAPDQQTLDLVAELLLQRADAHVADTDDLDTTAWLARALGASGNARYRASVEKAIAAYGNNKITKYGRQAIARMTTASSASYQPGAISLTAVGDRLKAERAAIVAGSADFAAIKSGDSLETIFAAMGYPDQVIETVDHRGAGAIVRSIQIQYIGHGLIDLNNQYGAGRGWVADTLWPNVANHGQSYAGASISAGDADLVYATDFATLQTLADRLLSQKVTDTAVLDRVAERLQISSRSRDPDALVALARFCQLLSNSGQKKYAATLEAAAKDAKAGSVLEIAAQNAAVHLNAL